MNILEAFKCQSSITSLVSITGHVGTTYGGVGSLIANGSENVIGVPSSNPNKNAYHPLMFFKKVLIDIKSPTSGYLAKLLKLFIKVIRLWRLKID